MMEDRLVHKELDLTLLENDVETSSMSDEDWKSLDPKCLLVIRPCISESILFDFYQWKTAHELWRNLLSNHRYQ